MALLGLALAPLLFGPVFFSSHARQPGSTTDLKDPFSTALRQHQKHAVGSFNSTQVSTVPRSQQREREREAERESNKSAARASLGLEATCEQLRLLRQVLQVAADKEEALKAAAALKGAAASEGRAAETLKEAAIINKTLTHLKELNDDHADGALSADAEWARLRCECVPYLLYWYKSTNTDTLSCYAALRY